MSSVNKHQAPHELLQGPMALSAIGEALLERWQVGKNVSQPFPDFDSRPPDMTVEVLDEDIPG